MLTRVRSAAGTLLCFGLVSCLSIFSLIYTGDYVSLSSTVAGVLLVGSATLTFLATPAIANRNLTIATVCVAFAFLIYFIGAVATLSYLISEWNSTADEYGDWANVWLIVIVFFDAAASIACVVYLSAARRATEALRIPTTHFTA